MGEQGSQQAKEPTDQDNGASPGQTPREKPEPDENDKEKAAEMMTAYVDRPTLVLPGTGGAVSGTAVGEWLDEDGNPKGANDEDAPAAKGRSDDETDDEEAFEEQVAKDKAFNEAVLKAHREKVGDEDKADEADADEDEKAESK